MIPNSNRYRDVVAVMIYRRVPQQDSYIIPNLNDGGGGGGYNIDKQVVRNPR